MNASTAVSKSQYSGAREPWFHRTMPSLKMDDGCKDRRDSRVLVELYKLAQPDRPFNPVKFVLGISCT